MRPYRTFLTNTARQPFFIVFYQIVALLAAFAFAATVFLINRTLSLGQGSGLALIFLLAAGAYAKIAQDAQLRERDLCEQALHNPKGQSFLAKLPHIVGHWYADPVRYLRFTKPYIDPQLGPDQTIKLARVDLQWPTLYLDAWAVLYVNNEELARVSLSEELWQQLEHTARQRLAQQVNESRLRSDSLLDKLLEPDPITGI